MKRLFVFCIAIALADALNTVYPCRPVRVEYGINCECTENYCDTLDVPEPKNADQFILVTSSKQGKRFSYKKGCFSNAKCIKMSVEQNVLWINQEIKHKRSKIIGFGGAFTDAVTYVLTGFSSKLRANFIRSYFAPDSGIGYNLVRVPIACTDYSLDPWIYDNQPKIDQMLLNFKRLDGRDLLRNIYIKEMRQYVKKQKLKILAAAWTPPLWMKEKQELNGHVDNRLIPAFYESYARYYVRWIKLMEQDGIPIWAVTPGNEPNFSQQQSQFFPGLSWDAGNQAEWVADYLAPKLVKCGNNKTKISLLDDTRDIVLEYLEKMRERRPDVIKSNDFISIHAYFDNRTSPTVLDTLYKRYGKQVLYTEMSFGILQPLLPGSWSFAEDLIHILMEILQHDVVGYIDWNMALDSNGGPSFVGGQLSAFIYSNENFTAFYKQPLYYAMAHFAKFIPPHSVRIDATLLGSGVSKVQTVAYLRPDNKVSVVLYNNDEIESVPLTVVDTLKGKTNLLLKPQSLYTLVYSSVSIKKRIKKCS